MINPIRKYKEMSFEQKTVAVTIAGLCFSAVLAGGKFVIGLFTDFDTCSIAVYTFALLFAKLECVLGITNGKRTFKQRNTMIAVCLFVFSVLYVGFTARKFFLRRTPVQYDIVYVLLLALISFSELGFAISGLVRTKNKGHLYRDIKIINFGAALCAILTTQIALLDFKAAENVDIYNAYSVIAVGVFIALCAIYILIAPKISVTDREHNVFVLRDRNKNGLIDSGAANIELILCKSRVFGSYVYRAAVEGERVDGHIERAQSLWKRMHPIWKVLCCIFSEILVFVWLGGRLVFFLRSVNLPERLRQRMESNGFVRDPG
ncbi:MAG: hypothetical protein ACI4SC_01340 [Candidatus Neoclostridium sp.]